MFTSDFAAQFEKVKSVYKINEKTDELKEEHFVALFYSLGFLNSRVLSKKENYYEMLL